jgi:hypothetical protein
MKILWKMSLVLLVPLMIFIMLVVRPILQRHYEPKWITKWYNNTDVKWFY